MSADTRQRIVEAASRLFHEQGFHATGISTILREAGVNRGSLYHFFPGKDELLIAVLEMYLEQLRPVILEPAEQQASDPIERVLALAAGYRHFLEMTSFAMGCPIGNLALEVADNHAGVRDLIDRNFRGWVEGVEAWVRELPFPDGVEARTVGGFVLTVIEGAIMRCRVSGSFEPFDESIAELRRYLELLTQRETT